MSRRLAPMALRTPISRVRSGTVASMMFIMPIPPTRSEMPAIVGVQWELPGALARTDQGRALGFFLNPGP
jgi:hypothetical protein